jgi:lambda family phage minor tail protein L
MAKGVSRELYRGILELEPSSVLEFFVIYYNYENNPAEFIPIHAGSNGVGVPIYWQGIRYRPFNIEGSAWDRSSDQSLPRPKIRVSNQGLIVSTLCKKYKNLNGAKVVRKRTLARFLDNRNFPNGQNPYGEENFNAGFADEKYYISRKISENKGEVEFELVTPLELENQKIPNRKVHSLRCGWTYRGYGCRYAGPPVADQEDKQFTTTDKNVKQEAEFILKADDQLVDTSKDDRGDFSTQITYMGGALGDVGLYKTAGGTYPAVVSTENAPFASSSIYFAGGGAICLSTGAADTFTRPSGLSHLSRTLSIWAKPNTSATGRYSIFDLGDWKGGSRVYLEATTTSTGYGYTVRASGGASADGTVVGVQPNGAVGSKWSHLALVYNLLETENSPSGFVKLYVNAEMVKSGSARTFGIDTPAKLATMIASISTGSNAIGGTMKGNASGIASDSVTLADADSFEGWLDDARIYDAALDASNIEKLYQGQDVSTISATNIVNRGEWSSTGTYNNGESAYVEATRYRVFSNKTDSGFEGIKLYFLCLTDGTTTDPRSDSTNWKRDACSKSIGGCSIRHGDNLPFGGYPGTHRYPFSARQNGY